MTLTYKSKKIFNVHMSAILCPKSMKIVNIHVLVFHNNVQFLQVKLLINNLQKKNSFQMN